MSSTDRRIPVLWLCGPPGVGKTAVGFELHRQLVAAGVAVAYVDIDQLGMCFPEQRGDPDRHLLKARNLDAVIRCFDAAGAVGVVVSGVVESTTGVARDELGHAALSVVRLRADHSVVAARYVARSGEPDLVEAILREADALDASAFANASIDTTDLGVTAVVGRVQDVVGGWPPPRAGAAPWPDVVAPGGRVLFVHGAPGVGKSTVGFAHFQRVLGSGVTAAYVDVDQLRFCPSASSTDELRARAAAAVWQHDRTAGAEVLVAVGRIADQRAAATFTEHLGAATTTWIHLTAEPDELHARILGRGQRGSWPEPGDELVGRSTTELHRIAEAAVGAQRTSGPGAPIDTTGCSVAEVVDRISAAAGLS